MGSEIRRIEKEFILTSVMDKGMSVTLHGEQFRVSGTIASFDEDFVTLRLSTETPSRCAPGIGVHAYFSFFGHVMTFSSVIRHVQDEELRIVYPEGLYRDLARKYERVPGPENARISFDVRDTEVELSFPKTEEFDPVESPEITGDFDPSDLGELVVSFRRSTEDKVSENTIRMFRDRRPSTYEERIISRTGKTLYIPDTAGKFPESDLEIDGRIITRGMLLQTERLGVSEETSQDALPSMLSDKRRAGILSEIWCPIVFHHYVVGYVYLSRREEKGGPFDHDLLEYTCQFTKVLAYALKVNGYFKEAVASASRYQCEVIDLSGSGLLFAHTSKRLDGTVPLYTDIEMTLELPPRSLRIGSRIMRKYRSRDQVFFGVQFMDIKPEDFRFLFEFVYGRAVTDEDQDLWEGGADPPELKLD